MQVWGHPDINARQKWAGMWSRLERLPSNNLRVLDAGCGVGHWSLELASRRPGWAIVGLDRDPAAIAEAERDRDRLGLTNVTHVQGDFLTQRFEEAFDVVLSVSAAHYLAELGQGRELFRQMRSWLRPRGRLLLLAPRAVGEAGFTPRLPRPEWPTVFTAPQLRTLCESSGLRVDALDGLVGPAGAIAKQLGWGVGDRGWAARAAVYPAQLACLAVDALQVVPPARSVMWVLEATADA